MMQTIGHNSLGSEATELLGSTVLRIEQLNAEKSNLTEDIREVYVVAKNKGFDVKIIRQIVARRKQDAAARKEMDTMLAVYESALLKDLMS